jgi:1,4-alpha-glucan branching enzyme
VAGSRHWWFLLGLGFSYDPMSLFAIHRQYGSPDDLKFLVDQAHLRGIAVVFDFVPNHMHNRNLLQWFDGSNLYFGAGKWEEGGLGMAHLLA